MVNSLVLVDDVVEVLSSPHDTELREIAELAAQVCSAAAAGISVAKHGLYYIVNPYGFPATVCPAGDTFCQFTMTEDSTYVIEDALLDERYARLPWVDGSIASTRFYASSPVYAPGHTMVGRLCVIDPEPKKLTPVQVRSLTELGVRVTTLLEDRLRATGAIKQAPSQALADRLAEIGHDLKVPLSRMVAALELVNDNEGELSDDDVRRLLERSAGAARLLGEMLDGYLDRATVNPLGKGRHCDLDAVLKTLVHDLDDQLDDACARVEWSDLPSLAIPPTHVYSALQNLLLNSVKFARPDVPSHVVVSAEQRGDYWRVRVSDNGVGIAASERPKVFNQFTRGLGVERIDGHGVGLASVARIVEHYDGEVGIEDSHLGGACVWLDLPAAANGSVQSLS